MKMLTVFIPESYIEFLDLLVVNERFPSRSEAIRSAIRDLVKQEFLFSKVIQNSAIDEMKKVFQKQEIEIEK
jgi:Arc/MetJ-type ribon-helix-helix transcriptional regulator